ncbi:band 7 protein [bacterium]|nr:band 7 protein [bacterium]
MSDESLAPRQRRRPDRSGSGRSLGLTIAGIVGLIVLGVVVYHNCRVDVGTGQMAILIRKTGQDLVNRDEVAPSLRYKGVQKAFLTEGRYFTNPWDEGPRFFNPYDWDWEVVDQLTIPPDKMAVLISLAGDDLEYGEFLGEADENQNPVRKGIVPQVLRPGRYPVHPYLFEVELHEPVTIDAGFKGVVTNLAGRFPGNANQLLVAEGERGVQDTTLNEGTHYMNPYMFRISKVDCRSQRYNLAEEKDMGFPSKDGFWVSLDGRIQFRIDPEKAAEVYVIYNEETNGDAIDEEIIRKVIMPNARSFCRLEGSNKLGKEFIEGETRMEFEKRFQEAMVTACEPLGIIIQEALITKIFPPEQIAQPIQERENARLEEEKFQAEIKQQEQEIKLAEEAALVKQGAALVDIGQDVAKVTIQAKKEQDVAKTKAEEKLAVARLKLEAAKDEAAAILARAKAKADVIGFENEADAAGWRRAVEAFSGNGREYAQYTMYQKLAAAYRRIVVNTADSPIMKMFDRLGERVEPESAPTAPTENVLTAKPQPTAASAGGE